MDHEETLDIKLEFYHLIKHHAILKEELSMSVCLKGIKFTWEFPLPVLGGNR